MSRDGQDGQVLVLVAGGIIGVLAIAALVLDIGLVWSIQRTERAAADAAALAGAQDLQTCSDDACTRGVNDTDRKRAREDALANLVERFGATGTSGTCDAAVDIVACTLDGTPYNVTIRTPALKVVNVDALRAVQVTVDQASVQLTVARLLGQDDWNVGITSVAGERFAPSYALLTLRPPDPNGSSGTDQNKNNVLVTGNAGQLIVRNGDIGSNTYAVTNSSYITLDNGFSIWHWDTGPTPDSWEGCVAGGSCGTGIPPGEPISEGDGLIEMPTGYPTIVPTAPTWPRTVEDGTIEDGTVTCTDAPTTWPLRNGETIDSLNLTCYQPGVYEEPFNVQHSDDVAYLEPGAYLFEGGLDVNGYLFGGIGGSGEGVTVIVPNTDSFDGTSASGIVLNTTCSEVDGGSDCWAAPVSGYESPDGYPVSIIVPPLSNQVVQGSEVDCFEPDDGITPALNDGTPCTGTSVLKLGASSGPGAGEAIIRIGGVIWAPTDNVTIGSNYTVQQSFVGRIVTWSVKYHGNAALYEESLPGQGPGFVALDAACSGGGEPCNP